MTDKEILDEVYNRLKESDDPQEFFNNWRHEVISFIEQEWQRQDELELNDKIRETDNNFIGGEI